MKLRILAAGGLALALGLATSGCGGDDAPVASPAPAVPSLTQPTPTESVSIYPPGQDSPGAGQPTESGQPADPGEGDAVFESDVVKNTDTKVTAKQDGQEVTLNFDAVVEYPAYSPPAGLVSLTWQDPESNVLSIGGMLYEGTRPTSSKMALTLSLAAPTFDTYGSGNGTCTVTFDRLDKKLLSGSFECDKLKGANGTTLSGAAGTFTARF